MNIVHDDTLANVDDFDIRERRLLDSLIDFLVLSDPLVVVLNCSVGVPSFILKGKVSYGSDISLVANIHLET